MRGDESIRLGRRGHDELRHNPSAGADGIACRL
jgi:hypothetical protein